MDSWDLSYVHIFVISENKRSAGAEVPGKQRLNSIKRPKFYNYNYITFILLTTLQLHRVASRRSIILLPHSSLAP